MNNHWESVFGWFNFSWLYDDIVNKLKDGDIIVELGTWLGKSTCYLAQKIKESNKKVNFYACDIFYFNPDDSNKVSWDKFVGDFYPLFLENLKKQEVEDLVIPKKMSTFDLAKEFKDNSINFLFIDDNHEKGHVLRELEVWYPKMKKDGILAGHDYPYIKDALNKFCTPKGLTYRVVGDVYILDKII